MGLSAVQPIVAVKVISAIVHNVAKRLSSSKLLLVYVTTTLFARLLGALVVARDGGAQNAAVYSAQWFGDVGFNLMISHRII
jgi:membrane associated rhomboid family serine protease